MRYRPFRVQACFHPRSSWSIRPLSTDLESPSRWQGLPFLIQTFSGFPPVQKKRSSQGAKVLIESVPWPSLTAHIPLFTQLQVPPGWFSWATTSHFHMPTPSNGMFSSLIGQHPFPSHSCFLGPSTPGFLLLSALLLICSLDRTQLLHSQPCLSLFILSSVFPLEIWTSCFLVLGGRG